MIMIGNDTYEDLTRESFETIVETFRAGNGKSIPVGTQIAAQELGGRGRRDDAARSADRRAHLQAVPAAPRRRLPSRRRRCAGSLPLPPRAGADQQGQGQRDGRRNPRRPSRARRASPKVSEAKAEGERKEANAEAKADGEPNKAMREDATGAESPAGKIDGGKAPRKPRAKRSPPEGAS